ncbi:hypothetical protein CMI37_38960, partial [Candidatus Pacearchaeota archaeon]|nr:hypothetical protein [Candidatus Pacearchaeota archaeon]
RGQIAPSIEEAQADAPWKGQYSDEELLQRYRKHVGGRPSEIDEYEAYPEPDDDDVDEISRPGQYILEDFEEHGGIQQVAREMPSLFGIEPQGVLAGEELLYDDRPMRGQYAPIPGGGITMQDGSTQKGSSEYPIGPGFARVKEDFERDNPGFKFTIYGQYGGIRSLESNFQRVLNNKQHWVNYFTPEAIAKGRPTKADLLPGKLEDLQKSPHTHANAADVLLNADIKQYGTVPGRHRGERFPSNEAMANSPQGRWMYANDSYNLLVRGWVPRGKGYSNIKGIPDPNADRNEYWHIEYNPEAAMAELRRLGYLDAEGFLKPPVYDASSRNAEIVKEAQGTSVLEQTDEQKLSALTASAEDDLKDIKRRFPEDTVGQSMARLMGNYQGSERRYQKALQDAYPKIEELQQAEFEANDATQRAKQRALSIEKGLRGHQSAMAKTISGQIEEIETRRVEKIDGIMQNMDAATQRIREMDISATRMFDYLEVKKDKDGKPILDDKGQPVTETNPLKVGAVILASLALITNAFFTFKSAAKKKGNKIPFLAWDMMLQAMNLDLRNQEAALTGEQAELNAEYNRLNYWNKYFGDLEAAKLHTKVLFLDYIEGEIKRHTAGWKDVEAQGAITVLLKKKEALKAETKAQLLGRVAESAGREMSNTMSLLTGRETIKTRKQEILIKAYSARGREARKRKKLNIQDQAARNQAFKFLPVIKEVKTLWLRSGGNTNIMLKGLAKTGLFELLPPEIQGMDIPGGQTAYDLGRIESIRSQYAAVLTKAMGETGALAEKEQLRAMTQIPLGDHSELGRWKIERLMSSMKLLASDEYYLMDYKTRTGLIQFILDQPDTPDGVRASIDIMDSVTGSWGEPGEIKTSKQVSREQEAQLGKGRYPSDSDPGHRGRVIGPGAAFGQADKESWGSKRRGQVRKQRKETKQQRENRRRMEAKRGNQGNQELGKPAGTALR